MCYFALKQQIIRHRCAFLAEKYRLSDIGVFERLIGARFQQNIRLSCASGYFAVMGSLLGIKSKRTNLLGPLAGRFMRLRDTL